MKGCNKEGDVLSVQHVEETARRADQRLGCPTRRGTPGALVQSTGKLVGEGFDHPPLDTLVLAMPISWKGTLQQYAGRLNREHADKTRVRIIDFVDAGHPALLRMWERRRHGYQAMGYRIPATVSDKLALDMPDEAGQAVLELG